MSVERLNIEGGGRQHLAYVDTHADGPAVLLLHGGGVDRRMWQPQLDGLRGMRIIAPDARGHGESSTPIEPYRLVDDVIVLLDELALDRVVAVGLSMGGGTAIDLAVEFPERVSALVVSGTGTSSPQFRDPWTLATMSLLERAATEQNPRLWIEAFTRFLSGPQRTMDQVDPGIAAAVTGMVQATLSTHVLPLVAQGRVPITPTPVPDIDQRRGDIAVPVLAITGELDTEDHRRLTRELLDGIPGAAEVVVPGTAHYPNLEQPALVNDAIARFVQSPS